jgi:hypothetical protein
MTRKIIRLVLMLVWLLDGCTLKTIMPRPILSAPTAPTSPLNIPKPTVTQLSPGVPTQTPDLISTVVALSQPKLYASYPSPNGRWNVDVIIYHCVQLEEQGEGPHQRAYEELKLFQDNQGYEKIVDNQLRYCGGLGGYGLAGLFWSTNNRYFYYTDAREGEPDGCGGWGRPILRLDVRTMQTERLGDGNRSPDATKLVTWQGREFTVWDMNAGEIAHAQFSMPDTLLDSIAWSPDSQSLVYLQITSTCPPSGTSYVVRVDWPDLKQTLLLTATQSAFHAITWDEPAQLRLFDENSKEWRFNLETKQLYRIQP